MSGSGRLRQADAWRWDEAAALGRLRRRQPRAVHRQVQLLQQGPAAL